MPLYRKLSDMDGGIPFMYRVYPFLSITFAISGCFFTSFLLNLLFFLLFFRCFVNFLLINSRATVFRLSGGIGCDKQRRAVSDLEIQQPLQRAECSGLLQCKRRFVLCVCVCVCLFHGFKCRTFIPSNKELFWSLMIFFFSLVL